MSWFYSKKKFCLMSGLKFTLSDVTLFYRTIFLGLKKLYSGLQMLQHDTNLDIHNIQKQPPEVFYVKGVLRNFHKTCRKHLWQSLFFNKVAGIRPATLLKKRLWHRYFPVSFMKFLRTPFLQTTSGQLHLNIHISRKGNLLSK